ncbi:IS5 family transposase [Adhaeribacter soli]|uniref:IS5 family transposase n=1 Tax=Adhaeribacter soli TaxID=2607655 RepID=A0A5N1IQT3_9BACT|nr:IS5 family transposase [Adhaeribacter soli]KAA9327306.1 IS5 family transposase [Adhaeribacter soli]
MAYSTDLTDSQWYIIEQVTFEKRKRQHSMRLICNLLFYLLKTGCQWRELPERGIKWQVVYYYFRKWQALGVVEQLHELLYKQNRQRSKRNSFPTAAVLDSQSVKTALATDAVGYDAGKKVKGRKRHLLVDTQGYVLAVRVSSAAATDRQAAQEVIRKADKLQIYKLKLVYADGGYRGKLINQVKKQFGIQLNIVKKKAKAGFKVLPRRWVVERAFAWLAKCRRLSIDYERLTATSEAFILLAMYRLMLNHYKN